MQLCLHKLVPGTEDTNDTGGNANIEAKDSANDKRKNRGCRAKGPLSCSAQRGDGSAEKKAMDLIKAQTVTKSGKYHFDDGCLADASYHRHTGLWAIDSANGNSWLGGAKYLELTSADIVLIQESKLRGSDAIQSVEDAALNHGWKATLSAATTGERGGASAGVGVAIRKHLGLSQPDAEEDPSISSRFTLKKLGAICRGGVHVGSIYLHDMVGPSATKNRDILDKIVCILKGLAGSWIIGGDWDCWDGSH